MHNVFRDSWPCFQDSHRLPVAVTVHPPLCWVPPPPRPLTRPDGQVLRDTRAAKQPDGQREVLEGPLRLNQTKVDRWYMSGDIGQLPSDIWQLAYDGCQLTSEKWNTALWQLPADFWYMTAGIGHKTDEICQLTAKNLTANSLLLTAVIQQLTANSWQLTDDRWQMTFEGWWLRADSWKLTHHSLWLRTDSWWLNADMIVTAWCMVYTKIWCR